MKDKRLLIWIAVGIILICFAYFFAVTFAGVPEGGQRYADLILGALIGSGFTALISFNYRSSKGSDDKTAMRGGGNNKIVPVFALALIGLWAFVSPLYAAGKPATFSWQQAAADTAKPDFGGWTLYKSPTSGGPWEKVVDLPFATPQTEYTAQQTITVPDGAETTLYFTVDCFDKSGNRSAKSNEVSATFDFLSPTVPVQFKIVVIGQ